MFSVAPVVALGGQSGKDSGDSSRKTDTTASSGLQPSPKTHINQIVV